MGDHSADDDMFFISHFTSCFANSQSVKKALTVTPLSPANLSFELSFLTKTQRFVVKDILIDVLKLSSHSRFTSSISLMDDILISSFAQQALNPSALKSLHLS